MKFPGMINRRLLHRQPDSSSSGSIISEGRTSVNPVPGCCSSFGSLHTQNLISFQTSPSTRSDCAEAKTLATADKCVNNDSICTPDQALPKRSRENGTTSSGSEVQKNSKSSVTNSCNNLTEDTIQFKDLFTSRVSTTGHDVVSKSDSSVSSQNQSKHPSTPSVCKSIKKLTRYPKSSAATKQRLQCEKSNDPERNKEFQADKSDMMPEISLCVSRVAQRNTDSHETKQGFKEISQTASDSSSQKEMRSEALPRVLFKTPLPKRSATTPAFKRTFKCQESNASLDNLKTLAQISFQRPGTPRPKSCAESLKWKKAFEQRSTHIRSGAVGMSNYQGQNRSSQLISLHRPVECSRFDPFLEQSLNLCKDSTLSREFTQRSFHENKSDSNYGIIDRQESTPCMPRPDDRIRQQKPNIPLQNSLPAHPAQSSPRPYLVP